MQSTEGAERPLGWIQPRWSDCLTLADWRLAPRSHGLYAIGRATGSVPLGPAPDNEGKLGGLPEGLEALYVGRSTEQRYGIRGRLGRHYRGSGNRHIAAGLGKGETFWFSVLVGPGTSGLEVMYLYSVPGFRPIFNMRPELFRAMSEMAATIGPFETAAFPPLVPVSDTSLLLANRLAWTLRSSASDASGASGLVAVRLVEDA